MHARNVEKKGKKIIYQNIRDPVKYDFWPEVRFCPKKHISNPKHENSFSALEDKTWKL
jgi:hypothetical protein